MSLVVKHQRLMTKFHKFQPQGMCLPVKQKTANHWSRITCLFNQQNSDATFFRRHSHRKALQFNLPSLKHNRNQFSTNTEQSVSAVILGEERIMGGVRSPMKKKLRDEKNTAEHLEKIAEVLRCSVDEVNKLSARNKFLFHLQPQLLHEKVQLLLSYGIPQSVINENIRMCYKISSKLLENRLKLMAEKSLLDSSSVRFLECEMEDFNRALQYIFQKREALEGCANMSEYIQVRLQCSESEAINMLSSPPFTKGYTSIKLKALLDFFLQEAKVDSQFLLDNSFIFSFSLKRLRHRLQIMTAAGIKDPHEMKRIWFYPVEKFDNVFKKYTDMS